MALITIRTFDNAIDAHLLKSKLESEGIQCYIQDENTLTLNPLWNYTVGGIKLDIDDSDIEQTESILQELEDTKLTNEEGEAIHCPNCDSTDLYYGYKSMKSASGIISAIISFLLFVLPIHFASVHKCKACGTEFK